VTVTASTLPGVRRVEHIMGMPIIVDIRDEDVVADDLDAVFEWFTWVDLTFSTFKPESEISLLSRGELRLEDADPEVRSVLGRCEELRVETSGYFDVRAASSGLLDPSGLVKGWSVDRAAAILDRAGIHNYSVNAGGDVRLSGRAVPAFEWRVGIQHPLLKERLAGVVALCNGAVATSGAYERGEHVLDPHTHTPPTGVLSVTVTGPDLATADAYATAAFAMGLVGPEWTAGLRGYEALTILADHQVLWTRDFPHAGEDVLL
jgi:thiamine biosynthesis lipoprotein